MHNISKYLYYVWLKFNFTLISFKLMRKCLLICLLTILTFLFRAEKEKQLAKSEIDEAKQQAEHISKAKVLSFIKS